LNDRIAPARRAAFEVLRRTFEHDAFADRALASAVERYGLDRRERAQAYRLAYGAVQRKGTADHLIGTLAERPVNSLDGSVAAALRLGLYELLFADATPDYAAVDQAVEMTKRAKRGRRGSGLVNAVLRRAAKEGPALLADLDDSTPEGAALKHSYPEWLARMWWEELGADGTRSLMAAMNEPAETALRVNTLRAQPPLLAQELRDSGESIDGPHERAVVWPAEAIVVDGAIGGGVVDAIASGRLIPQSRASQAVVALLDPHPGERVLDLCAGPGIKTTAIAARMEDTGELVSVEIDPGRAAQVGDLCGRAGVTCVTVEIGDAAQVDLGSGYDRILVDPPCSDLGTLASRPDARWRKSPELIDRLATLQGAILERAMAAVRPGGVLVYATCTVSVRESEGVVTGAIKSASGLGADDLGSLDPEVASSRDGRYLQLRPDRDGTDGFFIARMRAQR
jgi:16S rRNA (cytosine967-C5)-methyltransferase